MSGTYALYRLDRDNTGALAVSELVSAGAEMFGDEAAAIASLSVNGRACVVAYTRSSGTAKLLAVNPAAPFLEQLALWSLPKNLDAIEPLVIGNRTVLMCYETVKGFFNFFEIGANCAASQPYTFRRTHEPGTTAGFTMIRSFVAEPGGRVAFMGYNSATGAVAIYTLTTTATSDPGVPPLFALVQWAHLWAKGWMRFAFFRLGGGNYFKKTNATYENVNIDRILEDLTTGSIEVSSYMQAQLPDVLALTIVNPFYQSNGEPHFLTYKPDGLTRLYRIWGNCEGWDEVGSFQSLAQASHIAAVDPQAGLVLAYASSA